MPANMKKSGMSYKKGGSKKMYGGTMKKKMSYGGPRKKPKPGENINPFISYTPADINAMKQILPSEINKKMYGGSKKKMMKGGSNAKMPKSMYKKGGSKPDFLDFDGDGNKTEPMTSTYMYGGSMYKKMMKYAGGPVMNERGMKVPGMMKDGGGLKKMPGGGFMRSMDLPKAQKGFFTAIKNTAENLFGKIKKASNKNANVIDDMDLSKMVFKGTGRGGNKVFKVGADGKVQDQASNAMPLFQNIQRMLKQGRFKPRKK